MARCMGSGVVVLKYSAIERLMLEIKQEKKKSLSISEQYHVTFAFDWRQKYQKIDYHEDNASQEN